MNLDYLRYFVKLAQVGHYTRASEQLNISQPSLSHAVRQLEEELGVPLFERQGRNTQLTQFGAEFLDCAARTLATLDEGVTSLRRKARGEGLIRLGFLRVLGTDYVPRLAARFLAARPDRQIQFTFHSGRTQELLEGLADRRYDLVFCSRPAPELGLTAVPVRAQELVLIVPPGHPWPAGRGSPWRRPPPIPWCASPGTPACAPWWTSCSTPWASAPRWPGRRRRTRSSPAWWPRASGSRWSRRWMFCTSWTWSPCPSPPRPIGGTSSWSTTTGSFSPPPPGSSGSLC